MLPLISSGMSSMPTNSTFTAAMMAFRRRAMRLSRPSLLLYICRPEERFAGAHLFSPMIFLAPPSYFDILRPSFIFLAPPFAHFALLEGIVSFFMPIERFLLPSLPFLQGRSCL